VTGAVVTEMQDDVSVVRRPRVPHAAGPGTADVGPTTARTAAAGLLGATKAIDWLVSFPVCFLRTRFY